MNFFSWFHKSPDEFELLNGRLDFLIATLTKRSNCIMATLEELQASISNLNTTIQNERAQVQEALAAQAAKIEELARQIANTAIGEAITPEQIDNLMAAIAAIDEAVASIYTPDAPPVSEPVLTV